MEGKFYKIKNNINWRKEKGFFMVLHPRTRKLLIYNKKISSNVSKKSIIKENKNNKDFIKFLLQNKIVQPAQKPSFKLDFSSIDHITAPLNVTIQITDRCNLNCIHCHRNSKNNYDFNFSKFKELVNELRELNVFNINISGGEPILVKEVVKMIEYANKIGLNCTMSTNGVLLTKNLVKNFSEVGLKNVQISLDSSESEIHDRIRGYPGAFVKMGKNLILLRNNRINYTLVTTLINQSPKDYEKTIDLSYKLKAKTHKTNTVVPQGSAQNNNIPYLNGDMTTMKQYMEIWKRKKEEYKGKMNLIAETMFAIQLGIEYINHEKVPDILNCGCPAGVLTCGIDERGNVTPCPFFSELIVGNIYKNTFEKIWHTSKLLRELRNRNKIETCQSCEYKNSCGGCRARSFGLFHKIIREDPICFKLNDLRT